MGDDRASITLIFSSSIREPLTIADRSAAA